MKTWGIFLILACSLGLGCKSPVINGPELWSGKFLRTPFVVPFGPPELVRANPHFQSLVDLAMKSQSTPNSDVYNAIVYSDEGTILTESDQDDARRYTGHSKPRKFDLEEVRAIRFKSELYKMLGEPTHVDMQQTRWEIFHGRDGTGYQFLRVLTTLFPKTEDLPYLIIQTGTYKGTLETAEPEELVNVFAGKFRGAEYFTMIKPEHLAKSPRWNSKQPLPLLPEVAEKLAVNYAEEKFGISGLGNVDGKHYWVEETALIKVRKKDQWYYCVTISPVRAGGTTGGVDIFKLFVTFDQNVVQVERAD